MRTQPSAESFRSIRVMLGARIEHWQAGKEGYYKDALRAYSFSKQNGEYWFQTEWPAAHVPHIHFTVSAAGYRSITTQWIGDEDEILQAITFDIVLQDQSTPEDQRLK